MERNELGQEKLRRGIGGAGSWVGCEEGKVKDDIQVSGLGALLDGSVLDDEVTAEREGPVGQEWRCHQGLGAHWEIGRAHF